MPIIVIKFPIDWLHKSFKGSRPQINDEWDCPIFQCQVDVISRFARVQHQSIPLKGFEWQCDFITAALNRVQGQIVAEELRSFEGCNIFFFSCENKRKQRGVPLIRCPFVGMMGGCQGNKNKENKTDVKNNNTLKPWTTYKDDETDLELKGCRRHLFIFKLQA